jgi:hypothetical protein
VKWQPGIDTGKISAIVQTVQMMPQTKWTTDRDDRGRLCLGLGAVVKLNQKPDREPGT